MTKCITDYKTLLWWAIPFPVASGIASIFSIFPWSPPASLSPPFFFFFFFFFSVKLRSERCNHLYFWNGKLPQRKLGCGNALLPHPEKYLSLFHPILAIFVVFFISKNKHTQKKPHNNHPPANNKTKTKNAIKNHKFREDS